MTMLIEATKLVKSFSVKPLSTRKPNSASFTRYLMAPELMVGQLHDRSVPTATSSLSPCATQDGYGAREVCLI